MPSPRCVRAQSSSSATCAAAGSRAIWPLDVLRLAARAVERHHEPARDDGRDLGAVVLRDEVQAEVDPRSGSCRRVDAVVHGVERVGVDVHEREPAAQAVGVEPVRRRAPPVEQAGRGEHECARAERDDAGAARVGRPQLGAQLG